MRYQWRLLLRRSYHRSHLAYSSQVTSMSTRSYSSFRHLRSGIGALQHSEEHLFQSPIITSNGLVKLMNRSFSSEPAIEEKPSAEAVVIDVFSRLTGEDEIKKELESIDIVVVNQDLALKVLRRLESNPDVAVKFFRYITEGSLEELSSKTYNMMLRILGGNGLVNEFWGLVDVMKKKGHGLSANVRDKLGEKFQKDGLGSDLVRLRKLFSLDFDDSVEKICNKVRKIVMKKEWSDEVEKQIRDLKVEFQSDLVKMIVESLDMEPRKALLLFRWIDESGLYKHDLKTYNAMARVLGKENSLDRFQNIIEEMRSAGYQVEMETYVEVSTRFCQSNLIKEAVDLFEFSMTGSNTPSPHCCSLLLKKIVAAKKLDMELFSRAVKAYTKKGKVLTDSMLKSILKSLRSVDRDSQINEVLKAMKESGYIPSSDLQSVIVSGLSRKGKEDEASELINFMKTSENNLDDKAMVSLVEGYCKAGKLKEAAEYFKKMVGKAEISCVECAFEMLILAYCDENRQRDAYKLLIAHNKLKPRHSTYKILVRNLLKKKAVRDGGFEEALSLLPLMKDHGFPPFIDPFMIYFSKSGTSGEAFAFLKAMTSKNFPSITVVLRLFLTMLDSARHSEAQDLLSLCPNYIRNHADVLELFNSMKPNKSAVEKQPLADSA